MGKVKANALWNQLSIEQRLCLEQWLFDEGISYREAWQRARIRWQFEGPVACVQRFCRWKRRERRHARRLEGRPAPECAVFSAFNHLFN